MEKQDKEQIIKEFAQHETDTGSVEVQIAVLTQEINALTVHCQINKKDYSSKRGLQTKVQRRKRFLEYLHDTNIDKYKSVIERLGLRR